MKNKITALVLLTLVVTTSAFATNTGDNVNQKAANTFSQKFTNAKEVSWSKTDNYVKASFTINEQVLFAYFSQAGELMAVSRNIMVSALPINLQTSLKKDYPATWISELTEFATDDETVYYVTVENADQKTTLKSIGTHTWTIQKNLKKS